MWFSVCSVKYPLCVKCVRFVWWTIQLWDLSLNSKVQLLQKWEEGFSALLEATSYRDAVRHVTIVTMLQWDMLPWLLCHSETCYHGYRVTVRHKSFWEPKNNKLGGDTSFTSWDISELSSFQRTSSSQHHNRYNAHIWWSWQHWGHSEKQGTARWHERYHIKCVIIARYTKLILFEMSQINTMYL